MYIYYTSLGYNTMAHTVYSSRDTWTRTYGAVTPLKEGDISASTPDQGSIPARFPEIPKQPPTLNSFPPLAEHAGWSNCSSSPMTVTGSLGGSNHLTIGGSNQPTTTTTILTTS